MITKDEIKFQNDFLRVQFNGDMVEDRLDDFNSITRRELEHYVETHQETWVGKINLYGNDTADLVKLGPGDFIYNFQYNYAVPFNDECLRLMVDQRKEAPYTGTQQDLVFIEAIINRIYQINGILLNWA